ncbi:hypothetical protein [Saccharothrix syringae]|nr:hypothetical protein [Saccharothrix syringae]
MDDLRPADRPAAHQPLDAVSGDPHSQFVLPGARGAGRSTLAVLCTLAAV